MESLVKRLGAAGGTVTAQRTLVCKILEKSNDHPDAEEIFARARKTDRKVSLATVYRVLKALDDYGLIITHDFGDNRTRYEVKRSDHHDHLVCVESGRVIEFNDPELEALKQRIAARLGYALESHSLELYGRPASAATSSTEGQ